MKNLENILREDLIDAINYVDCVTEELKNNEIDKSYIEDTKHDLKEQQIIKDYIKSVLNRIGGITNE